MAVRLIFPGEPRGRGPHGEVMEPHVFSPAPPETGPLPPRIKLRYLPALDGLRACAIIFVLLYHARVPGFRMGRLGVDLFLVLSGFLITSILLDELRAEGRINLVRFYLRRGLRLLPAFFVMVGVSLIASSYLLSAPKHQANVDAAVLSSAYMMNWRTALGFTAKNMFIHCWSLSLEEQFYLLWPLILWSLIAHYGPSGAPRAIVRLIAAVCVVRCLIAFQGTHWDSIYEWTHTRADSLLAGCVVGCCYTPALVEWVRQRQRSFEHALIANGALLLVLGWTLSLAEQKDYLKYAGFTHVALTAALLVIHLVVFEESRLGGFLSSRPLVHVGRLSYGLYLWHYPIIKLLRGSLDWAAILLISALLSYLLAAWSYRFIEQPLLRLRERWARVSAPGRGEPSAGVIPPDSADTPEGAAPRHSPPASPSVSPTTDRHC